MSDKHFSSVDLLLGFNGADGATSTSDESMDGRTVSFFGHAQLDTSQQRWGTASLLLDGTGDYLTVPDANEFDVDTGDVTMECWVRINAVKMQAIFAKRTAGTQSGFMLQTNSSSQLELFVWQNSATPVVNIVGSTALSTGAWYHVAATRSGTLWRTFLDGALQGSVTQSNTPAVNSTALHIGRDNTNTARDFNGWIDDLRWTKGVARYTGSFIAPRGPLSRAKRTGVTNEGRSPSTVLSLA